MNLLKNNLVKILSFISYLNIFKKKIIVYSGSSFGYSGHSKYLYEYLVGLYGEEEVVFVSKEKTTIGHELLSIKGLLYTLFGHKFAVTVTLPSFVYYKRKKVIQFWHGVPVKNIGCLDLAISNNVDLINRLVDEFSYYDAILCPSQYMKDVFKVSFPKVCERQLVLSTTPNYQRLSSNSFNRDPKLIAYLPTYREGEDRSWDLVESKMYEELLNLGYDVVVRYHPIDPRYAADSGDTQDLIQRAALVITDYSSVIFDCIASRTPFALYTVDLSTYRDTRGINTMLEISEFNNISDIEDIELAIKNKDTFHCFDYYDVNMYNQNLEDVVAKVFGE